MKLRGKAKGFLLFEHLVNLLIMCLCILTLVNITHLLKTALAYQNRLDELRFADACLAIDELINVSYVSTGKTIIFEPFLPNDSGYLIKKEYRLDWYAKKQMLRLQSSDRKGHMPLLLNGKHSSLQFIDRTLQLQTTIHGKKYLVYFYPRHLKETTYEKITS